MERYQVYVLNGVQQTHGTWRRTPEFSTWALLQWHMNSHIKWDKEKLKLSSCEFRTGLDNKYSYKKVFGFRLLGV